MRLYLHAGCVYILLRQLYTCEVCHLLQRHRGEDRVSEKEGSVAVIWGGPLSGSTSPGTSWWSPSSSPASSWSAATPPSYTPSGGPPTTWSSWLTGHKSCGVNVMWCECNVQGNHGNRIANGMYCKYAKVCTNYGYLYSHLILHFLPRKYFQYI